jgi:Fic family protein
MIKKPPKSGADLMNPWHQVLAQSPELIAKYMSYLNPVDSKARYLPYDEFQYRVDKGIDPTIAWQLCRHSRRTHQILLLDVGENQVKSSFYLTSIIQKAVSYSDRYATNSSLELMSNKIGESHHFKYLLNDLMEDESISSSQLEGAATTTKIAKSLIKHGRKPRTIDERMILGNFKMMNFAWEKRDEDLSVDLIQGMHKIGTEGINNDKYFPGAFRQNNDVYVADRDGEVLHIPPSYKGLTTRINNICSWINKTHDSLDSTTYLHPLIKAITLHFLIGYEHPFQDGNGRVARALFYWYMFKHNFAAFRYIAVSTLLKKAPSSYANSYLHTEHDELDMTYFLDYQCSIIIRAITEFNCAFENALKQEEKFTQWLWKSGLYKKLSEKQRVVFQVARDSAFSDFTVSNVKTNLSCSYNTAAKVMNDLVDLGLFTKTKGKKEWVYNIVDQKNLMASWS